VDGIVWEADPETLVFRFVSKKAERLLGYPRDLWLKEPQFWVEHIHPEDRSWVPGLCRRETQAQRPHEFEYRMIAADGRVVWLHDICSVGVEHGRVVSLRGVMVDITVQKQGEEALRVASERVRTLVGVAPIVLVALDAKGVFDFCEGSLLARAGISAEDFVGHGVDDVLPEIPDVDALRRNWRRALAGEEFTVQEELGGVVAETRYMTRRDEKGEPCGAIGLVVDVTDRVRAEKDRRAIETQMQHTQKLESLGVLAGGVAHDFNNLLMAVLGNADLVLADLPGSGQARGKVERIQRAARAASHLTQQLLSYSGTGELDAHPLDLSSLVAEMTDLLLVSISKKAELRCDLADGLPPVDADAARMTQVILNLVINASDALGDEHGEIRVRTGFFEADRECAAQAFLHGDLEEGPYLFLEVSDTGVGMDEVTRSRIFDPFFTTKFVGRGLGLATTLGIVRGHGGTVSVYSEPGEGTRFRVLLPCAMGATAVRRAPPAVEVSWKASGTLLVVDDEPDVREIAQEMAERLGFDVHAAGCGNEAVAWLRGYEGPLAAVLLDVTMPDLGGDVVARELRRIRPELPIVLMSGFHEDHARMNLPAELRAGFLQKPFARDDLVRALRDVLPGA